MTHEKEKEKKWQDAEFLTGAIRNSLLNFGFDQISAERWTATADTDKSQTEIDGWETFSGLNFDPKVSNERKSERRTREK